MLDYSKTFWVRQYKDTRPKWTTMDIQARGLFWALLNAVNLDGELELGDDPIVGIAAAAHTTVDYVNQWVGLLVQRGSIQIEDNTLIIPNFVEAQTAVMGNGVRCKKYRSRKTSASPEPEPKPKAPSTEKPKPKTEPKPIQEVTNTPVQSEPQTSRETVTNTDDQVIRVNPKTGRFELNLKALDGPPKLSKTEAMRNEVLSRGKSNTPRVGSDTPRVGSDTPRVETVSHNTTDTQRVGGDTKHVTDTLRVADTQRVTDTPRVDSDTQRVTDDTQRVETSDVAYTPSNVASTDQMTQNVSAMTRDVSDPTCGVLKPTRTDPIRSDQTQNGSSESVKVDSEHHALNRPLRNFLRKFFPARDPDADPDAVPEPELPLKPWMSSSGRVKGTATRSTFDELTQAHGLQFSLPMRSALLTELGRNLPRFVDTSDLETVLDATRRALDAWMTELEETQ